MSSSVPELQSHPSRSSSDPGISDATVNINPLTSYRHGRPQQFVRVRLQGVFRFVCFQPLYTLEGGRSRYEVGFAIVATS
jgi:hypothetical protein